jgi:quercetin dioxygenase-like cupin family protein
MSIDSIVRRPLLNVSLGPKTMTSVDVREITFAPGPETGKHKHSCPVVGFIAEGAAVLEVKGEKPQKLPAGSSFTNLQNA